LYLRQSDGKGQARRLTTDNGPFKYSPTWAPDSKSLVFWDKAGTSFLHVLATEEVKDKDGAVTTPAKPAETRKIDTDPWGSRRPMSFSHDGRWLAYARGHEDARGSSNLWVYDTRSGERHQLTSGMFDDSDPAFDRKGEFLYFVSSRNFRPIYSELDTTFIYNGSEVVLAVPLRADVKSPFLPVSDEETWKGKPGEKKDEEKKDGEKKEGDKDEADKKDDADKEDPEKKGEPGKPDPGKEDDGDKPDEPDDAEKKPAAEPVKDDGVSGTWAGKATGPEPVPAEGFPFTLKLTLNADGTVSGTMTSAIFTGAVTGSYDAATRALTLNLSIGATPVTITLTIDGPRMSGSATVEGRTYQLSAERTAPAGQDVADPEKEKPKSKDVVIDLAGFERRAIQIPIKPGNFGGLAVNDKGHLVFARLPVGGEGTAAVKVFDPKDEKKEEKEIASGTAAFELTPDGKKILLARGQSYTIQDASAGSAAAAKSVPTTGMTAMINPREEWRQILNDAWRIQRDFFYVANMHGVDWPAVKEQYARMLADCATREDVAYVLAEMISELNVGHAYVTSPGDVQQQPTVPIGTLGCDFELVPAAEGLPAAYRITRIYRGADWDSDAQGPLSQPGVDVKEGDFLLAINGVPLDTARDPWAALQGMAGRTVTLTVSQKQLLDDAAREAVVECAGSESNLRYRAWIEAKRAYVDQKSGGTVGYIYVPNTGIDGQSDLFRQFYGQVGKQALIIDERWNGGGQIPTRFIELLNRPATNYWARRDGKDWTWPPDSHQGPKCMLINGLAGSGGDMFPALFKQNKIGPTIGTRTWGGLVGISGNPGLIDGGYVSVPTFGFYEKDGTWGIEGHGVDPDVEVVDDPALMVDGGDPQLDKAIQLMTQAIKTNGYTPPKRPADPDRRGMGIRDEDR
ncbi:MAG TPA: PDZ domain-containing protein, partial [Phycisphaerales bacterium]|nr:PDZ domain-containing protein [Phycisphaerales bacterium]